MKYSFITQKKKTCPVGPMYRQLGVSRSAYHNYEQYRRNKSDDLYHQQLLDAVRNIAKSCDYTHGCRRMKATLVGDALRMAIGLRRPPPGSIVHSDRGS